MSAPFFILPKVADIAEALGVKMESLNAMIAAEPPQQHALFTIPPEGVWVYRVEVRRFSKYADGHEDWTEWGRVFTSQHRVLPWYKRKADAEKALKRYQLGTANVWSQTREYRVEAVWYETQPFRRDIDLKERRELMRSLDPRYNSTRYIK